VVKNIDLMKRRGVTVVVNRLAHAARRDLARAWLSEKLSNIAAGSAFTATPGWANSATRRRAFEGALAYVRGQLPRR